MSSTPAVVRAVGRYSLYGEIAAGGMATVHFGRFAGPGGFARTVAIKRMHPQFARDPEFVSMFLDEARLAARVRHPNVTQTLDVVAAEGELFLVMEYVESESLSRLLRGVRALGKRIPPSHAVTILAGVLYGLHAAHEATNERNEPLGIVHRDVSPQNVLVGADGIPRVIDFGVAKATGRLQTTQDGQLKGKLAYMSPEQLQSAKIDRRTDIWAAGAVLWEVLVGERLFRGDTEGDVFGKVLNSVIEPPSKCVDGISPMLDEVVMRSLARSRADRFETARDMARALEKCSPVVSAADIAELVAEVASSALAERAQQVVQIESSSSASRSVPPPEEPGTRVKPKTPLDVEPATSLITAEPITSLSSGSISHPQATAPKSRYGWRDAVIVGALVVASIGLVVALSVARTSKTDAVPTVAPTTTPVVVAQTALPSAPTLATASATPAASSAARVTPTSIRTNTKLVPTQPHPTSTLDGVLDGRR